MKKLAAEKLATVIVVWSGKQMARAVINMATARRLHNRTWIATEAWGRDEVVLNGDPRVIAGLFGILPSAKLYQTFEKHIVDKQVKDLLAFRKFHNNLYLPNCSSYALSLTRIACNENYMFTNTSGIFRSKITNVVNAVYAVAYGLEAYLKDPSKENTDFQRLLQSIKNVNITAENGVTIAFDQNGDPNTASYSLVNLKLANKLEFQVIADWNSSGRRIEFTESKSIYYSGNAMQIPRSKCADQCLPGLYAFRATNKKCCWKCVQCPDDSFKAKTGTEHCSKCPARSVPNINHTTCIELEEIYLQQNSRYGITLTITTTIAAVPRVVITLTFMVYRNTPLVKSSNVQLSLLQLGIALLACTHPFLYIGKPTLLICYLRPLVFGVLFTISNSIIFNKADRLLRIFKMRHRVRNDQLLLSNKFQLCIVALLAFCSVLICAISFILSPPQVVQEVFKMDSRVTIRCENIAVTTNLLVAYINMIGLTCIIYTFRSRNLPRQYRERRYIGLAMFVAMLAWVAYLLVYFSTAVYHVTNFVFCLSAQLANGILLVVIYGQKTWSILFHPEQNTIVRFRHGNRIAPCPSMVSNIALVSRASNAAFVVGSNFQKVEQSGKSSS